MSIENRNLGDKPKEENEKVASKGLNDWNDRLDENLESDEQNDPEADKNSKDFFEDNEQLDRESDNIE